ncbi:hypothetical protein HMPREF3291_17755 [Bacillus sp. HMSC76G11]|nr:hypothetical protein HMPREF3291_17755 [Bacillus sp. HMSC76G11]
MADGEITKLYKNSRRKNHSYREHYGIYQEEYRIWKASLFKDLLYLTSKSQTLRSKSLPLFTELYPYFYDKSGHKRIPFELLEYCNSFYFLAILYLDDGSLCITKRINHKKKVIYLSPTLALYLQCYSEDELLLLKRLMIQKYKYFFYISKRKDGQGFILKLSKSKEVYNFLNNILNITKDCTSMHYKTNWSHRINFERENLLKLYPGYRILAADSRRNRNYTSEEIELLINLKKGGSSDNAIAEKLNRSYWSVVYKISELRKNGLL